MERVIITDKAFDPEARHAEFRKAAKGAGAITAFTGLVRDEDGEVGALTLSHYPGMTEKEITKIGEQAASRWPLKAWHITHRVGDMHPGEVIVFVATASAHRRASFEAADFLMDYLKSEAPFWKQERRGNKTDWIEPRASDKLDIHRWKEP